MRQDDKHGRDQEQEQAELVRRGYDLAGRELVEECQAFLDGRYAEHLSRRGRPIPVWVWTNVLAHGTAVQLRGVAKSSRGQLTGTEWTMARQVAARQVLDVAQWGGSVEHLQATVLVPLELALAACPDVSRWRPTPWLHAVAAALRDRGCGRDR